MKEPIQIRFLYTNIGRGHPFYLDGIIGALSDRYFRVTIEDVFDRSTGLAYQAWRAVRWFYKQGFSRKMTRGLYQALRETGDIKKTSLVSKILGRDLASKFTDDKVPLVVGHP